MTAKTEAEDFTEASNPEALFNAWFDEAERTEINDANAMTLATVDQNGMPNARVVLLKGLDARGFVFYTNFESAKGQELLAIPKASLCFHWKSLRRQSPHSRNVGTGEHSGSRRLLCVAPHGKPHRRLGQPAIAATGEPRRTRSRRWRASKRSSRA